MPRKKSGNFDNKAYQNEYHKAMKTKLISFNPNSSSDMELWDYLQTKENQTGYIKGLILEDKEEVEPIELEPFNGGKFICSNCHWSLEKCDIFCSHCGRKIGWENKEPQTT